jgi:hypothetical protein
MPAGATLSAQAEIKPNPEAARLVGSDASSPFF